MYEELARQASGGLTSYTVFQLVFTTKGQVLLSV